MRPKPIRQKKPSRITRTSFASIVPHEHRPAGRPLLTTPLTPILEAAGADFAVVDGWERAAFFKPAPDYEPSLTIAGRTGRAWSPRRWMPFTAESGLPEINGFNRIEPQRPWRDRLARWIDLRTRAADPGRVRLGFF